MIRLHSVSGRRVVLNAGMYKTKCSGQTPSLNFTSRTCSKNHINWYKPRRVLYLQTLNVDEEEHLEQAEGMSCTKGSGLNGHIVSQCIAHKKNVLSKAKCRRNTDGVKSDGVNKCSFMRVIRFLLKET